MSVHQIPPARQPSAPDRRPNQAPSADARSDLRLVTEHPISAEGSGHDLLDHRNTRANPIKGLVVGVSISVWLWVGVAVAVRGLMRLR